MPKFPESAINVTSLTSVTLRRPILLSLGTSRQSSTTRPGVKVSTLLGSPVADTIIIMVSWPNAFVVGVHSNGPKIFSSVLLGCSVPADTCAVLIGCKSSGQSTPADGLQWYALTTTSFATVVPRFLILT